MRVIVKRHGTLNAASAVGGVALLGLAYLAIISLPELIRYVRISRM
jgi:hypothetical protein